MSASSSPPPSLSKTHDQVSSAESGAAGEAPRIRLMHVIGSMRLGGAEKQLAELIARLPAERFEQRLVLLEPAQENELLARLRAAGCEVESLGMRRPKGLAGLPGETLGAIAGALGATLRLRALVRAWAPDVVHAQLDVANVLAVAAVKSLPRAGRPTVVTSRLNLTRDREAKSLVQRAENWANRRADAVFVNSRAVADEVARFEGVNRERLRLIYNGVDTERFGGSGTVEREAARAEYELAAEELAITVLANLHAYKGHADLLHAVGILRGTRKELAERVRLLFAGEDRGAQSSLKALARELGLAEQVKFLGGVSDVPRLLAATDVVVHPSHEEGFSNALLEAMAAGRAVIATRVGGNAEALGDEAGLLVPARNPSMLAGALARVLGDAALRERMGASGRRRAVEKFSFDRMVEEFVRLYEGEGTTTGEVKRSAGARRAEASARSGASAEPKAEEKR